MSRFRTWSAALSLVGGAAAAGVSLLTPISHSLTARAGFAAAAGVALVVGAHLLVTTVRGDHVVAMRLTAVSLLAWGVSLALTANVAGRAPTAFPGPGQGLADVSAAVALLALGASARTSVRAIDLARLALDALLLGSAGLLLTWRLLLGDLFQPPVDDVTGLQGLAVVAVHVLALAFMALMFLRDVIPGVLLGAVGCCALTAGDVFTLRALAGGQDAWPWQLGPLACLAAVLLSLAAVRFADIGSPLRAAEVSDDASRADARMTIATTVASLALLGTSNVSVLLERQPLDRMTMVLTLVVVAVFAAREVVAGLLRQALLRGLTALAYRDPLTTLGNRRSLAARHRTLARGAPASLLTLDLDGFKEVNDSLGHARGDALLVAVADSIRRCLPEGVEAFRTGGDEFAVLVPGDPDRASAVADRLLSAVREAAADVPGAASIHVSASIGVAVLASCAAACPTAARGTSSDAQEDQAAPDVLRSLVESGVALRAAKAAGRDRVERYDGPVAARHRRVQAVERRLGLAIEAGSVVAHLQPVVDLTTRRVVGFEALARWHDSELGTVVPDEFIPVAERSGLIGELGAAVTEHAIAGLAHLHAAHPWFGPLRMGVNASVVQLRRPGYCEALLASCERSGVDPQTIIVEVTESLFVDPADPALHELRALRAHGVNVAIDDFGSGYSSLAYLSRMPANVLKLDRELVSSVDTDARARSVVVSIATLARSLPMDLVMEGIETTGVHQAALSAGGEYGQGWLYGAAVPLPEVAALVRRINAGAASSLVRP